MRTRKTKQKTTNKMIGLSPSILIVTLNVNGLNKANKIKMLA